MSVTIVETTTSPNKKGVIAIKPFVNPNVSNMGLENYGLAVFDNTRQREQLACIERDGIKRYLTGLNEFAPEVTMIENQAEREAKVKAIREAVSQLEKELGSNIVKPEDPDFWNKVKTLKPDNSEFWDKIEIECANNPVYLDPAKPYDRIRLFAIEAGGFSIISSSYEQALNSSTNVKFYLDRQENTVSTKTEVKKLRNRALSELQKLFDKNTTKLMLVAKIVDINSVQYKVSTPIDILYDNMDRFINGDGVERNRNKAPQVFLDATRLDPETLKIKAIVRDATFYKFISPKADGFIYHTESGTLMGRNIQELVEFLKNPLQESILNDLSKKVERNWQ